MFKKLLLFVFLPVFGFSVLSAQATLLKTPELNYNDTTAYEGLGSNGITQIKSQGDSILWLGTGAGLSWVETDYFQDSVFSYYSGYEQMPKGGVSAIETEDSSIWIASVFDSTTREGKIQTGGGLSFSGDGGETWSKLPQPVDAGSDDFDVWNGDTIRFLPIITPVQNTTWDIAIDRNNIYTASWAGGLRRTSDNGQSWERIPLPADDEDTLVVGQDEIDYQINPRNNYNHMGFSVLAYNDTLWVGTAKGINKGIIKDNTIEWIHYSTEKLAGITGDFVVALYRQSYGGDDIIWAVTLPGPTSGESQGICYTEDGGQTWQSTMDGFRAYDIVSAGEDIFVATRTGLYKLSKDRNNWSKYDPIIDNKSKNEILTDRIYALLSDGEYLWAGTNDGLGRLDLEESSWSIYHESVSTEEAGEPEIYAYPNPFYPRYSNIRNEAGHVRIKFNLKSSATVWLEVYDFAMERVYKGAKERMTAGDRFIVWDGTRESGELVANGTYFCKLTRKTNSVTSSHWTKLLIMK